MIFTLVATCLCICHVMYGLVYFFQHMFRLIKLSFRYGWSRARYVYSLISGVGIFFLGAGVTMYHGVSGLMNPSPLENLTMVSCDK